MDEEGLGLEDAIRAVLSENLHGLEIDPRCTQIAAFNVALAAWKLAVQPIYLPSIHIACSGLSVGAAKGKWISLAGDDPRLRAGMEQLYDLFEQAPVLGSLIDPKTLSGNLLVASFAELQPLLEKALVDESEDDETHERVVAAKGMAEAAELLANEYALVVTNVPYLGRGSHGKTLQRFGEGNKAGADLCTLMLERILKLTGARGSCSSVLPRNWWIGRDYRDFRCDLLASRSVLFAIALGEEAWSSFGNRGPHTVLMAFTSQKAKPEQFFVLDVSTPPNSPVVSIVAKEAGLRGHNSGGLDPSRISPLIACQDRLLRARDCRITLYELDGHHSLGELVTTGEGSSTGDKDRYVAMFWEIALLDKWVPYSSPGTRGAAYCDTSLVMHWENGCGDLASSREARIQSVHLWPQDGILVGRVRGITATLSTAGAFTKGAVKVVPLAGENLLPILCCLASDDCENAIRTLDPRVSAATSIVSDVPVDLTHWQQIAAERYSNVLPEPQSDDPTQWLFHGHPAKAEPATALHVAVGRLLGHRWPPELDPKMWLAEEAREWVAQCDDLLQFADEDSIVCIPSIRGEQPAAERLRTLLTAAFGDAWTSEKERDLITETGSNLNPWTEQRQELP